jgi:peptidoglycan/LPS O-acetylase OafA/YrhL
VVLAHGGLAYILVDVVTHFFPALGPYAAWSGLLWHGGFVGVELFFVLSGFLIGRILLRTSAGLGETRSLFAFYCRRWFRTLPLFWLAIAFNVAFERFFHDHRVMLGEGLGHALFLRNFAHTGISFIPESWSLAVEEWFYLLFPASLWLGLKITRATFGRVFVACAVGFFLFSLGARTWAALPSEPEWDGALRCTVIYRFDALMTGVIAAWLAVRFPEAWKRHARLMAFAGIVIFAAAYASLWTFSTRGVGVAPTTFFAKTLRFDVFSLGFACLLPAASQWVCARENAGHLIVRKAALWSYALYLVHWPLFQLAAAPALEPWRQSWSGATLVFLGKITLAVVISALLYHFYEAPCTRLRERVVRRLRPRPVVAAAATQVSG